MSILNVISLFGGLAMFLYGMRMMSGALKEGSTGTMKAILGKVTDNFIKSFLLGVAVTALIQSSTATIVICSGLVAAGLLSLKQSLGIIVGANIGTTVTGQIIRLMDLNSSSAGWLDLLKPSTLAPLSLIIGIIFIMFLKMRKANNIGTIFMGFGILFSGLMNMTNAVSVLNANGAFDSLFVHLSVSPLAGYGIGALVSFILQSSSATVGILQAFSVSGKLFFRSIYPVLLGVYLGDCTTTAIVCSIGAKAEAKRVGAVNVLYNFSKTLIVVIGVFVLRQLGLLDGIWDMTANSSLIANTNTIFNIACALIVLPFLGFYEKLANIVVKDDKVPVNRYESLIAGLDPKFFTSPSLAFTSCYNVLTQMYELARKNIDLAFELLNGFDEDRYREIDEDEDNIDLLTDKVNNY
ncbi:MAG: Na/Pi cotransporter family protein, partial [Erysipelotrichaceae bacterium]|nr:Na/Pi cotransporter family protein [Erysipelotrichaceae bacterium]